MKTVKTKSIFLPLFIFALGSTLFFSSCLKNELKDISINKSPLDITSNVQLFIVDTVWAHKVSFTSAYRHAYIHFTFNRSALPETLSFTYFHIYKNGKQAYSLLPDTYSFDDYPAPGNNYKYEVTIFDKSGAESKNFFLANMHIQ